MRLGIRDSSSMAPPSTSKFLLTMYHLFMEWGNTHVLLPRVWRPANANDGVQGNSFPVSSIRPIKGNPSSSSIRAPSAAAL